MHENGYKIFIYSNTKGDIIMNNTKPSGALTALAIVLLVLSVAILALTTVMSGFAAIPLVESIIQIAVGIVVLFYILSGFSKKYNSLFKIYFIASALAYVIDLFMWSVDETIKIAFPIFMIAVDFVCFAAYVLLTFASDIGKKASLIIAWIPVILYATCAVYYAVLGCSSAEGNYLTHALGFAGLVAARVLGLFLVKGKYADKAARKGEDANK